MIRFVGWLFGGFWRWLCRPNTCQVRGCGHTVHRWSDHNLGILSKCMICGKQIGW